MYYIVIHLSTGATLITCTKSKNIQSEIWADGKGGREVEMCNVPSRAHHEMQVAPQSIGLNVREGGVRDGVDQVVHAPKPGFLQH